MYHIQPKPLDLQTIEGGADNLQRWSILKLLCLSILTFTALAPICKIICFDQLKSKV